jgi:ubiquinone/menaquinone biosynthesis C-methylase UbiE
MGNTPVQSHFDVLAERYVTNFEAPRSARTHNFVTRLALAAELAQGRGGRLLDCACGTGEVTAAVVKAAQSHEADLVDLTPAMLERCRSTFAAAGLAERVRFHQGDAFTFEPPAGPGGYRLVLCLGLIAHTGRVVELLSRLRTFLEPGGSILLQSTLLDHPGTRVVRALTERQYARRHGYSIHYTTLSQLEADARAAGLVTVRVRRFCTGVPFADRVSEAWGDWTERMGRGWAERHGAEALLELSANG